jgi:hypothetical protein
VWAAGRGEHNTRFVSELDRQIARDSRKLVEALFTLAIEGAFR